MNKLFYGWIKWKYILPSKVDLELRLSLAMIKDKLFKWMIYFWHKNLDTSGNKRFTGECFFILTYHLDSCPKPSEARSVKLWLDNSKLWMNKHLTQFVSQKSKRGRTTSHPWPWSELAGVLLEMLFSVWSLKAQHKGLQWRLVGLHKKIYQKIWNPIGSERAGLRKNRIRGKVFCPPE